MSDDLIKREDAIGAINGWLKQNGFPNLGDGILYLVPSADRPQGEWIRDRYWSRGVGMGEDYGFFYKCSLCEYEVENGYTRCGFNYCPYCGADMRKGASDE